MMTEYTEQFATMYADDLETLFDVTGFTAEVVDTGGGMLNIEVDGGDRPGTTNERLLICVTNSWDGGLADEGEARNPWYVTLRDEDMEIVADAENEDLGTAVRAAYAKLRAQ